VKHDTTNIIENSITFPSQKRHFTAPLDSNLLNEWNTGKTQLFFWAVIDYDYDEDNHGEYGVIAEIRKSDGLIRVLDEWAN